MSKVYLVTGASYGGLGWEACRQLGDREDTKLVYLACRSMGKAVRAIDELELTGISRWKFRPLLWDASWSQKEMEEALDAVSSSGRKNDKEKDNSHDSNAEFLRNGNDGDDDDDDQLEPLDGVLFNAGGPGSDASGKPTGPNKVLDIVQINLVGHVHLLNWLEKRKMLKPSCHIIYSGSESARGYLAPSPIMCYLAQDFADFMKGASYTHYFDLSHAYGFTKGLAVLYFAKWARIYAPSSNYRVYTISPGQTPNTQILHQQVVGSLVRFIMSTIWMILGFFGYTHSTEVGAHRYVDGLLGEFDEQYPNGTFLASRSMAVGPLCDQSEFEGGRQYADTRRQDAAYLALQSVVPM